MGFRIFMILDLASITKCYCMLSYCSKNHLKSHKWQKNSSTPNFIEIGANLWILELFMNSDFTSVSICYHIFPKIIQKVTYGKKTHPRKISLKSEQNHRFQIFSWFLDFTPITKYHYMIFYWFKNHLDSYACPKDLSIPNFIEIRAKSWILDFFMTFGFHSNNKVSLFDLVLV